MKNKVTILSTAAIIPFKYDERKKEYIEALRQHQDTLDADPTCFEQLLVIESTGNEIPSFLEEEVDSSNICYTKTNNSNFRNKGINEFISVKHGLNEFIKLGKLNKDSWVCKITGRYLYNNLSSKPGMYTFLYHHNNGLTDLDLVASLNPDGQLFTGFFAAKAKEMIEISNIIEENQSTLESHMINVEYVAAQWAKNKKAYYIDFLNISGQCAQGIKFVR